MSNIHYFQRYSQQENVVTNNTLQLFLRLYEFSHLKFEKLLDEICERRRLDFRFEDAWLEFQQQKRSGESVPDAMITQRSVKIVIETKLRPPFDSDQLLRHLRVFNKEDEFSLLILLSPSEMDIPEKTMNKVSKSLDQEQKRITIVHLSFLELIRAISVCLSPHDDAMREILDDFETFCSDHKLLPRYEYIMFTPPCSQSFEENRELRLYYCPAERSTRKAHYLGVYYNKIVGSIGIISNIIECNKNSKGDGIDVISEHRTTTSDEKQRIMNAMYKGNARGWNVSKGHKFFLCDEMEETNFKKISSGGIQNQRYLDLGIVLNESGCLPELATVATRLREKTWE